MNDNDVERRYEAVCSALEGIAQRQPALRLGAAEHPCELILQTAAEGPSVLLQVWPHRATVHAHSGSDPAGTSELSDHLSIDLTHGFQWDSVSFEGAEDLVYHLFKHMLRRQKSVSGLEPHD